MKKIKPVAKKNAHAQSMARMRSKSLTPERRKEIAQAAAAARWDGNNEK